LEIGWFGGLKVGSLKVGSLKVWKFGLLDGLKKFVSLRITINPQTFQPL
jgi:hypothetical protein